MDEELVDVGPSQAARTAAGVVPGVTRAVQVARMPRGIGASVGVNETVTGRPADRLRFCSISGVCRWVPPTPYGDMEPITSAPSRCGLSDRPAPEVPLAATITTSSGSSSPAAKPGARARLQAVG